MFFTSAKENQANKHRLSLDQMENFIRWNHPSIGWVKLNTDGASKGYLGSAGGGGLIRGHRDKLFEVFAINCGFWSSTKAELMAFMHRLLVAWDGGHRRVRVEVILKLLFVC